MSWEKDILDRLKDYPNSFQLEQFVHPRRRRYAAVVEHYLEEILDSQFEEVRNENFITLLFFKLDETPKALEVNEKVLLKDPGNVVALANRVYLKVYTGHETEAKETLEKLKKIKECKEFAILQDKALGEIAYSYTRMGPRYYHKAITLFTKIIERRPEEYLLKFGLALTIKRCLTQCIFSINPIDDIGTKVTSAIKMLENVIHKSKTCDLEGKSYILLGEIYKMLDDCAYPLNSVIVSSLEIHRELSVEECYTRAYKAAGKNWFVLERAGKYFRKIRMYGLAENLLKRAIEIRPKSIFAHHHLGLVYKEMATEKGTCPEKGDPSESQLPGASNISPDHIPAHSFNYISSGSSQRRSIVSDIIPDMEKLTTNSDNSAPNYGSQATYEQLLSKAEDCLVQSLQVSNGSNTRAVFDLGILYNNLDKPKKAEEQFRKLIEKEQPYASPLEKANAYEQLGLIFQHRSLNEQNSETQQRFRTECKLMLTKSIEEAAKAVVGIPGMETSEALDSWKALPTLEELLLTEYNETKTLQSIKEVAKLRALLCKYKSSLDLYTEIQGQFPAGFCDVDVIEGMIDNYLKLKDFDNAFLLSLLLQSSNKWYQDKSKYGFYKDVFLTCGMHFLEKEQLDKGGDCFKNCFKIAYPASSGIGSQFDIFILDDLGDTRTEGSQLKQLLECCRLNVTRNDDSVRPGSLSISGQTSIMEDSKTVLIILSKVSDQFQFFIDIAITLLTKDGVIGNIVVVKMPSVTVPTSLKNFTSIEYRRVVEGRLVGVEDAKWLHKLLKALLDPWAKKIDMLEMQV